MRDYHRELYEIMREIRKIKFTSMIPDLTGMEFDVLCNIQRCGEKLETVRISDIVRAMHIPPPAVSRVMKNLEEAELLVRSIDTSDRRNMIVELTGKGEDALARSKAALRGFAENVFDTMGQEKTELLIDTLCEFAQVSKAELEKQIACCGEEIHNKSCCSCRKGKK